jgi:polar amino acid transport system permease protein
MIATLRKIRPSTLVLLAAAPFIFYLFAASSDYQRALRAIVGVDIGASAQVPGFLLLLAMFAAGALAPWRWGDAKKHASLPWASAALALVLAVAAIISGVVDPFAHAIVANAVDPFTSPLVVPQLTPRRLTADAAATVSTILHRVTLAYLVIMVLGLAYRLAAAEPHRNVRVVMLGLNGAGLVFLLLFAYLGFAVGIATTLRAAVFAYALALLLGLLWVALLQLHASMRALVICAALTATCAAAASLFLLRTPDAYAITGKLPGKIGIIKGTPSALVVDVRFGRFQGDDSAAEIPVKTFADATTALAALNRGGDVTALLIPAALVPEGAPVLWRTAVLKDRDKTKGVAFLVFAVATGLMGFAGYAHRRHPLSVTAEFIIDTIRGIPMLVIVLYVGLPLSGALKDATQGVLDPPNFVRGVVAMAVAYSAYLAEIMRAGIKAIPKGQFEAAASLGLTRLQVARFVVIPQAFRIILPALGNELIAILKDTSLLSILSIRDVTQRMREFQSASFLPFAPYNSATVLYIFLTLAVASLLSTIERKYDLKQR